MYWIYVSERLPNKEDAAYSEDVLFVSQSGCLCLGAYWEKDMVFKEGCYSGLLLDAGQVQKWCYVNWKNE